MRIKEDILACTAAELNYGLAQFVKEITRPNGERYEPDSIYYLCLGIQQVRCPCCSPRIPLLFGQPLGKKPAFSHWPHWLEGLGLGGPAVAGAGQGCGCGKGRVCPTCWLHVSISPPTQYLLENNRMVNIFTDLYYLTFVQELNRTLSGWQPTVLPNSMWLLQGVGMEGAAPGRHGSPQEWPAAAGRFLDWAAPWEDQVNCPCGVAIRGCRLASMPCLHGMRPDGLMPQVCSGVLPH